MRAKSSSLRTVGLESPLIHSCTGCLKSLNDSPERFTAQLIRSGLTVISARIWNILVEFSYSILFIGILGGEDRPKFKRILCLKSFRPSIPTISPGTCPSLHDTLPIPRGRMVGRVRICWESGSFSHCGSSSLLLLCKASFGIGRGLGVQVRPSTDAALSRQHFGTDPRANVQTHGRRGGFQQGQGDRHTGQSSGALQSRHT